MGRHLLFAPESGGASGTTRTEPATSATIIQCAGGSRVEERIGLPRGVDVLDTEVRVFEQVGDLAVDLERVNIVEEVEVEQIGHRPSVLQTNTNS